MQPLYDGAKNLIPTAAPLIGVVSSVIKISAIIATGPVGIVAEECSPPMVWVSGKCVVLLACYVGGTITCNPVWFGAGTTVLNSIL